MLLGLAADIHGNIFALEKTLEHMSSVGVEELIIAGDFTGYYYHTSAVLSALSSWRVLAVKGNHESMLDRWMQGIDRAAYQARYGSSFAVAEADLNDVQLDYLLSLPPTLDTTIDKVQISVVHATPRSTEEYLYPDASAESLGVFESNERRVWVVGHTHYPVVWIRGDTTIINPGSVGQQRCGRPGAHWATYDTDTGSIVFYTTPYDTSQLERECQSRDPHVPYLREILTRSWP